jgi:hypothetical protein
MPEQIDDRCRTVIDHFIGTGPGAAVTVFDETGFGLVRHQSMVLRKLVESVEHRSSTPHRQPTS